LVFVTQILISSSSQCCTDRVYQGVMMGVPKLSKNPGTTSNY